MIKSPFAIYWIAPLFDGHEKHGCITCPKFVMPSTKHIESKMFDLPVPLSPVMAVNSRSNSLISVRFPYDLNPSSITDLIYIAISVQSTQFNWILHMRQIKFYAGVLSTVRLLWTIWIKCSQFFLYCHSVVCHTQCLHMHRLHSKFENFRRTDTHTAVWNLILRNKNIIFYFQIKRNKIEFFRKWKCISWSGCRSRFRFWSKWTIVDSGRYAYLAANQHAEHTRKNIE